MRVESLPDFTQPARKRWDTIPANIRQGLLNDVWCGHCHQEVIINEAAASITTMAVSSSRRGRESCSFRSGRA